MGAYTNPQEVLDTQTGQYFQNLQSTISQTVAGVATAYKAESERKKKEIKENADKLQASKIAVEKTQSEMLSNINKLQQDRPNTDFSKPLDPFITAYGDITNSLNLGTVAKRQDALKLQNDYKGMIGNIQDSLAIVASNSEGFMEKYNNSGQEGGYSQDPNINPLENTYGMLGMMQKLPGNVELETDISKGTGFKFNVNVVVDGVKYTPGFGGAQLKGLNNDGAELFTTIPKTTDDILKLMKDSGIYNLKKGLDKKGDTTSEIQDINESFLLPGIQKTKAKSSTTGTIVNELSRGLNLPAIEQKIASICDPNVAKLLVDPKSAAAWYNEVGDKALGDVNDYMNYTELLTGKGKDRFKKMYIDYTMASLKNKPSQPIMNTEGNIATETIVTKKLGGPEEENKLTPNQVLKLQKEEAQRTKTVTAAAGKGIGAKVLLSPDGKMRAVWDNDTKKYMIQNKTSSNTWKTDRAQMSLIKADALTAIGI